MANRNIDLERYSKADLIWIINRLAMRNGSAELFCAVRDLQWEKEKAQLAEADRLANLAHDKRMEYINLLSPYAGVRYIDIPLDVLKKADAAMKEAQAADAKWSKLMEVG